LVRNPQVAQQICVVSESNATLEKVLCSDESCTMSALFFKSLRRTLIILSAVWAPMLLTDACLAQEAASVSKMKLGGRIADQPIVVGYARNVTPGRALDYIKNLTGRLEIGKTMRESLNSEQQQEEIKNAAGKVDEPLYGFAGYMVQLQHASLQWRHGSGTDSVRDLRCGFCGRLGSFCKH
jgi:hypothetical protein